MGLTKQERWRKMNTTTAEVAHAISTPPVWQLPGTGKAPAPKDLLDAKRADPGAAQNMRGTVIQTDGVLPGGNQCVPPVPAAQGFLLMPPLRYIILPKRG